MCSVVVVLKRGLEQESKLTVAEQVIEQEAHSNSVATGEADF